jgi:DNA-binding GntR family transcriptional regulator
MKKTAVKAVTKAKPKGKAEPASNAGVQQMLKLIEDDIVVGRLLPGQRLDERTLAERFSVSRTPIREALLRLSSVGIVELRRNQGAFVAAISPARLIGMLEVMAEMKVLAARQAARRMTDEERKALVIARQEIKQCVDEGNTLAYFEKASALHEAICEGTHNSFLVETVRIIQVCLCAYRRHLSRILHKPTQTSLNENLKTVDAILAGDAEQAEHWMRQQTDLRRDEFAELITMITNANTEASEALASRVHA